MSAPERILSAAAEEFAVRGLHGVRMEHVAKRAKLNKALVYRHFRDKERLFDETLRQEIGKRAAMLDALPEDLRGMLLFWSRRQRADAAFVRLIAQEGLRYDGSEPRVAEARRSYYARQVADLRELRRSGRLPADIDIEALFFALLLLTVGPILLPQIKALVFEDEDGARWDAFLARLADLLGRRDHPGWG